MAPKTTPKTAARELHAVPLTLEGASVLHQMFRFRWAAWKTLPGQQRASLAQEAAMLLSPTEGEGSSALYAVLGHKADLLLLHYRDSLDQLKQVELQIARLGLHEFLEPASSFLSVVELGLYDSSLKLYRRLQQREVEPHSAEWTAEVEALIQRQREAMRPRLYPRIPTARHLCFYPMDRRRGEQRNWYRLPIEERQRQMEEHGAVGRRYAGKVQQIISGAIGFDDWEWGVDLFAEDPVVFKKLIYEMRFDEVSALYALFGPFYVGLRCPIGRLGDLLDGNLPH